MKKSSLYVVLVAIVIGMSGCSSKETKAEEPLLSGSSGTEAAAPAPEPVAEAPKQQEPANLGKSSSGQSF